LQRKDFSQIRHNPSLPNSAKGEKGEGFYVQKATEAFSGTKAGANARLLQLGRGITAERISDLCLRQAKRHSESHARTGRRANADTALQGLRYRRSAVREFPKTDLFVCQVLANLPFLDKSRICFTVKQTLNQPMTTREKGHKNELQRGRGTRIRIHFHAKRG
jgi:hypothetical protein